MNIKILDSWLREYLKTSASPEKIATELSLTSVSIERIEKHKKDYIYDIEITTNRPDLASVNGLAREAGAVLPQQGIHAEYMPLDILSVEEITIDNKVKLSVETSAKFINRICAVVLDVQVNESPEYIKERLETSGIRSLNNLIDITNYVMRVTGQPTHIFDYDRLEGTKIKIRESIKGEKITTLDKKVHSLPGGDIIAENAKGEIIDLLAIMGLANSVVTSQTKRIVFFINNIDANHIRRTSMTLGIRTEAAQLNEKHLDPELCGTALSYGIQLFQELAHGKVSSDIIDIYPHPFSRKKVSVSLDKIDKVIGFHIPEHQSIEILTKLGFHVSHENHELTVVVPSFRANDIALPEDLIEEIARVHGYHNLPSNLPILYTPTTQQLETNQFYWEQRAKNALKYWGFTECYTYSMVSETAFEGPLEEAVTIENPLNEDFVYMRRTLVPSLLQVLNDNKQYDTIRIFEIANVYCKRDLTLPQEIRMLAGIVKKDNMSFFVVKGYIEQLFHDLSIHQYKFLPTEHGGDGASIFIEKQQVGEIEILDSSTINFEINFDELIKYASLRKKYTPASKFPPILEDLSLYIPANILTTDVLNEIKKQSSLVQAVSLLDRYEDTRTFHIIYQDKTKNLTNEEMKVQREKIIAVLKKKWGAQEK